MLWDATLPDELRFRSDTLDGPLDGPLDVPLDVDVAVVGGGYTGLWTAFHLRRLDPGLRVVVLERDHVGAGASGRNGGWCSGLLPVPIRHLARRHGRGTAARAQRVLHRNVADVVAAAAGFDAQIAHAGTIDLVRTPAQQRRAEDTIATARSFGFGEDDVRLVGAAEARRRCGATRVLGGVVTPHCAAVHPARLVHGLARAAARLGVVVHEGTTVTGIRPGRVTTDAGTVRADVVVRATEGYTAAFDRRALLPLYSMMIATEPLPAATWERIGLDDRATFADLRHTVIYGQRTADDRLAFGGRGAPYHFGSRVDPRFDTDERVRARLVETLHDLFPAVRGAAITHHWGGPLGIPRDLHPGVVFDGRTATVGGYTGDGVALSHLLGRTLAHLISDADGDDDRDEIVRLPWVGHRSRRWEPEPARWLGVNAVRTAAALADGIEARRR